jgi:hypothetical protein
VDHPPRKSRIGVVGTEWVIGEVVGGIFPTQTVRDIEEDITTDIEEDITTEVT